MIKCISLKNPERRIRVQRTVVQEVVVLSGIAAVLILS